MALTSTQSVFKLVAGMLGGAPGTYLDFLVHEFDAKGELALAIEIGNSPLFGTIYPATQGGHVFAGAFLAATIPGYTPTDPAHLWALNWMADQFDQGVPAGQVILNALHALETVPANNPTWGPTLLQWEQRTEVAQNVNGSLANATVSQLQDAVRGPVFQSAEVNGTALVLHYADGNGLDASHPPLAVSFNVSVAGVARTVSQVAVNGTANTVTLTLASAVAPGEAVTVGYTDPSTVNDASAIQDRFGNDALSLATRPVTNNSTDTAGPAFASGTVNASTVVLTMTDATTLDATHVPAVGAFTVTAGGVADVVTAVAVNADARTVTLTLTNPVTDAQVVTIAYKDPTTGNDTAALQDALGNDTASFGPTQLTNTTFDTTGPTFVDAHVDGSTLTLQFADSDQLRDVNLPSASAFAVKVGGSVVGVTAVRADAVAKTIILTLAAPATFGQAVTVAYTDPTKDDDLKAIQDASGNDAASIAVTTVANDTPDAAPPTFVSASVNGSSLTMTYSEQTTLDGTSSHLPPLSAFAVKVDGSTDTVSAVAINETAKTVTLTLANPVVAGAAVTVAYTDPSADDDTKAIQDAAGNDAATLKATSVANATPDVTAPIFNGATVNGNTLVMTYADLNNLDSKNAPTTGAFGVTVDGNPDAVSAVAVNDAAKTVTLTLNTAVTQGQAVKVAYTDPTKGDDSNAIQDIKGNDAASLAATTVTNNTDSTAPTFSSAAVNGTSLVLTYNEALDSAHAPSKGAFAVHAGGMDLDVTGVAVNSGAHTVTLTLGAAVQNGMDVTLDYTDPTGSNDANAIQDASGNDANSLSAQTVTNNTAAPGDTTAPVLASASIYGDQLTLTYNESLDSTFTADVSQFKATVASKDVSVTDVAFGKDGSSVVLTLASGVTSGDAVTVDYTDASNKNDFRAIQDAAGNDAASLTAHAVDNVTPPVYAGATINGDTLVLNFNVPLDETHAPDASAFTVKVNDLTAAVSGNPTVDSDAHTVTLTLAVAVVDGDKVEFSYTDPTSDDDANAIQDLAGHDSISTIGLMGVTNETPVGP